MFVLQHALTQGVIRRRAPLSPLGAASDPAVRDRLEEGDWLTVRSDDGLFDLMPVATTLVTANLTRIAYPIVIEPSQPDAVSAGLTVVHGDYIAQTDRYVDPTIAYLAGDSPPVPASTVGYASGTGLLALSADEAAGLAGAGPHNSYLYPADETVLFQVAKTVAYVERDQADNNGLLQLVVF